MSVAYYNTRSSDNCLTKDPCPICLEDVTAEKGQGHDASSRRWWQRLVCKRPPIQHAIHSNCLEEWIRTRLNSGQLIYCPTCKDLIALPLKDRIVSDPNWIKKHALIGATIAVVGGLELPFGAIAVGAAMALRPAEMTTMGLGAFMGAMGAELGVMQAAPLSIIGLGAIITPIVLRNEGIPNSIRKITIIAGTIGFIIGAGLVITGTGALAGVLVTSIVGEEATETIRRTAGAVTGVFTWAVINKIIDSAISRLLI